MSDPNMDWQNALSMTITNTKAQKSCTIADMLKALEKLPLCKPMVSRIECHPDDWRWIKSRFPPVSYSAVGFGLSSCLGGISIVATEDSFPGAAKAFDQRGRFMYTIDLQGKAKP